MYNNFMAGQGMKGDYYDSDIAFADEKKAVDGSEQYEELQGDVVQKLQTLENDFDGNIDDVAEGLSQMASIYEDTAESVDKHMKSFVDNAYEHPDAISDMEAYTANLTSD